MSAPPEEPKYTAREAVQAVAVVLEALAQNLAASPGCGHIGLSRGVFHAVEWLRGMESSAAPGSTPAFCGRGGSR